MAAPAVIRGALSLKNNGGAVAALRGLLRADWTSRATLDAATPAANLKSIRMRKLRAFEMGQIRDNFRQTQPCNGRMALPARKVDRSTPRLTVNKI